MMDLSINIFMKTEQIFHLEQNHQQISSEIQVARNSEEVELKSTVEIKPQIAAFNDLRGLSWIILEEYN